MPNRVSHTYYYMNFKKILKDSKNNNPDDNGASIPSNVGEALEESLSELDLL